MSPQERLEQLERGEDSRLIVRLSSGICVMGDSQWLPGYALLLASPIVGQLNDLEGGARAQFLADMAALGDAVRVATHCVRINYGIYGNLDPFLHAHVWPRFDWETPENRSLPPLSHPKDQREDAAKAFDLARHGDLVKQIRRLLENN